MEETPYSLGYRMPAEWEPHEATWLSWPKDPTTFPRGMIEKVEWTYVKMIDELSGGERVNLLVEDDATEKRASGMLKSISKVAFHHIHSVDVWIRDYGPIFVKNGSIAATKWIFNAWGNKYEDLLADNQTGFQVAGTSGTRTFEPRMVLEGGSIDVNGLGSCLATTQCLLNKNRNPSLDAAGMATFLKEYLGVTNLIWLESGIAGDDTDGHVDDIARFVSPNRVICMIEEDREDENYSALLSDVRLLQRAEDQKGERLIVDPIPMPRKIEAPDGRLPASYANFYIGNVVVLVPTFNDERDKIALKKLEELFPDRRVVGISCEALVYGFGGIHCVTQQQPSL
jgi:agmatine deiminase